MNINLVNQINNLWLQIELFKPDDYFKIRFMQKLYNLFLDYSAFLKNIDDEIEISISLEEFFLSDNYIDYLTIVKNEISRILIEITTSEQLSGLFLGLLGHEMVLVNKDFITVTEREKEFIMLHNLKLFDIAYQEPYQSHVPFPEDYIKWIHEHDYPWESLIREPI